MTQEGEAIDVASAFLHGAFVTLLDGLGTGLTGKKNIHFLFNMVNNYF